MSTVVHDLKVSPWLKPVLDQIAREQQLHRREVTASIIASIYEDLEDQVRASFNEYSPRLWLVEHAPSGVWCLIIVRPASFEITDMLLHWQEASTVKSQIEKGENIQTGWFTIQLAFDTMTVNGG